MVLTESQHCASSPQTRNKNALIEVLDITSAPTSMSPRKPPFRRTEYYYTHSTLHFTPRTLWLCTGNERTTNTTTTWLVIADGAPVEKYPSKEMLDHLNDEDYNKCQADDDAYLTSLEGGRRTITFIDLTPSGALDGGATAGKRTGDDTSYDGSGHVTLPDHVTWCQKSGDTSLTCASSAEERITNTADFAPTRDTSLHDAVEYHQNNPLMMINNKFLSVTSSDHPPQSAMFASVDVDYSWIPPSNRSSYFRRRLELLVTAFCAF